MNQYASTNQSFYGTSGSQVDSTLEPKLNSLPEGNRIPEISDSLAATSLNGTDRSRGSKNLDALLVNGPESMPASRKLTSMWTLYCTGPIETVYRSSQADLKSAQVAQFDTVNSFWGTLNNVPAPSRLVYGSTYSLFRASVAPRWEDPANECGGQWVMLIRNEEPKNKNDAMNALWEAYSCAIVGEDLDGGARKINGMVYKVRPRHFAIQIWTKSAVPTTAREIGETLRSVAMESYPQIKSINNLRFDFYSHQQMQEMDKKGSTGARPQPLLQL
ncbi:eukaryotic translation initiation factor 4E [Perkinsela sp. CCAP 1560/4]|nr:eukaryotic translation initiation factor 4E [Perkinsela sp. CCAP 1560/4]|eukprot:KNH04249.1 eukaryotic translation initiation factor 4E [Perkinsela sp. CCAP 1560/4]